MRYITKEQKIKSFKYWRWYWYRGIPFVVAEVINQEYDKLKEMKADLPSLWAMYNDNGNWYVLEHPLYWFLDIKIGKWSSWCFEDSMHMWNENQTDDERWQYLVDTAENDIDNLYSKINPCKIYSALKKKLKKNLKK